MTPDVPVKSDATTSRAAIVDRSGMTPGGPEPALWRVVIRISCLLALGVPALAMVLLLPLVENFPSWDQWHLIPMWQAHFEGRSVLPILLTPYSKHLNIIPRGLFLVLGAISHWDVRLEVVGSFCLASGTLLLIMRMLRDTDRRLLVLAAPIATQVFSLAQFENFLNGYCLGQVLSQFAATLVVYWITRPGRTDWHVLAAGIAAFVSVFSWGAGLVSFYVAAAAVATESVRRRLLILVWLLVSGVMTCAVFLGAGGSGPAVKLQGLLRFFFALIAKSVSLEPFPDASTTILPGVALVVVLIVILGVAYWRGLLASSRPWVFLALLGLSSGGLVSLGRHSSGQQQAYASHYVTAVYPILVSTLVLVAILLLRKHPEGQPFEVDRTTVAALGLLAVVVSGQALVVSARTLPVIRGWNQAGKIINRKIIDFTATDEEIHGASHPDAALVRFGVTVLQRYGLACFAGSSHGSMLSTPLPRVPLPGAPDGPGVYSRHLSSSILPDSAFRVRWDSLCFSPSAEASSTIPVTLTLTNTTTLPWPAHGPAGAGQPETEFPVRLAYRWLGVPAPWGSYDGHRIDLSHPVVGGASETIRFDVVVPDRPGESQLQIDALQERVAWFESKGADRLIVLVNVTKSGGKVLPGRL